MFGKWDKTDFAKMAGFDMDWTLVKTKSGKIFAANSDDWLFLFEEVKPKLI